jgi:hypothetical protein
MSLPRLYPETTIPSYLMARPNRDVVIAGHLETAREWWTTCRERFDVFISPFVVKKIPRGDAEAARLRQEALRGIPELPATPNAEALAAALLSEGAVPDIARTDAAHIAIAAVHDMDFLVMWNCQRLSAPPFWAVLSHGLSRSARLQPHRQCREGAADSRGVRAPRLAVPGDLHTGAIAPTR